MKGYLTIVLSKEENLIEISPFVGKADYLVTVCVNNDTNFKDIINSEQLFKKMLDTYEYIFGEDEKNNFLTEYLFKHSDEVKMFVQNFNEFSISGNFQEVRDYIKENNLQGKDILYNEILPLSEEMYIKAKQFLGDIPNIKFYIEGNDAPVTLEQYEATIKKIEDIANKVRSLGLSPIEEIMYVYDLVRDREYVEEDDSEEYTISRDLSSVLFGDKIVCVGFTKLFNSILDFLGFKTMNFPLKSLDDSDDHMRSLIYVQDEKYKIDGMYFFDPTFDCKKDNECSFLEIYLYFAKSYSQIIKLDRNSFESDFYVFMDEDSVYNIDEKFTEDKISLLDLLSKIKYTYLNKLLRLVRKKEIILISSAIDKDYLLDKIYEISTMANCDITYETFLEILYNVRKKQYYENPQKYIFDIDSITNILGNSKVADKLETENDKLLAAIFGYSFLVRKSNSASKVKKFVEEKGIEHDMARVKLVRTLKTVLERKEEEERKLSLKK